MIPGFKHYVRIFATKGEKKVKDRLLGARPLAQPWIKSEAVGRAWFIGRKETVGRAGEAVGRAEGKKFAETKAVDISILLI